MKKYLLILVLMTIHLCSFAQDNELPQKTGGLDKSKLFVGGNLGLTFGNYTLINLSPQVGYRFNDYFAAGVGVNFIYSSLKSRISDEVEQKINQGVGGLNIFGRVYPIKQILMLQAQPELNYTWGKLKEKGYNYNNTYKLESKFVPSLLLGAGAAIPQGPGSLMVLAQYDILQQDRNPYGDKIFFSIGYTIGF